MHCSYALSSEDFSVERNGASEPLDALWPSGWQPDDRLGVLLANPMDAVGCSNLICGTITLFYDLLREKHGTGNFFRYSDVYPVRGRLRAGRLQPARRVAAAQVRLDPAADRRGRHRGGQRPPDHAARATRDGRALQRRGRPVDLEHLPRPGARRSCSTRPARARPATATSRSSATRSSRATSSRRSSRRPASTPGYQTRLRRLRRNIDRDEKQSVETLQDGHRPAEVRGLIGVTQVLPPGHQELTRRATPTVIMPVEVPMPPIEAMAAPFDLGLGRDARDLRAAPTGSAVLPRAC